MENIKTFNNISQRILFSYKFAYSVFTPIVSNIISIESQRQLHLLMQKILDELYVKPELLSLPIDEDRAYPQHICNNQIPELDKLYQTVFKTLYEFYRLLYMIALYGKIAENTITITKEQLKVQKSTYKPIFLPILNTVGIEVLADKISITLIHTNGKNIFLALKLLASENQREYEQYSTYTPMNFNHNLFSFAVCSFDGNFDYLLNRIDDMYEYNGLLMSLKSECLGNGYKYITRPSLTSTFFSFAIIIRKNVGGFIFEYNPRKEWKISFGTFNGIGEKAMLDNFDNLEEDMKEHFISICRPCNGCRGCTKGGKNKVFTVRIKYNGNVSELCPMFPNHCWETIDKALIDRLIRYHDLQEIYAK